jgi:hypothetical protein
MILGRFQHNFVTLGNRLYQCGGSYFELFEDVDTGDDIYESSFVDSPLVEYYDVLTDTWTELAHVGGLSFNRNCIYQIFGICPLNGFLYDFAEEEDYVFLDKLDLANNCSTRCFETEYCMEGGVMLLSIGMPLLVFDQLLTCYKQSHIITENI